MWNLIVNLYRKIKWVLAALSLTIIGTIILIQYHYFSEPVSSILREFGVALIIAGTVSLVYELFLRVSLARTILELLQFTKSLLDAGLKSVNIKDNSSSSLKFLKSINPKKIRMLGITTDYYFTRKGDELYDEIDRLLKRNC